MMKHLLIASSFLLAAAPSLAAAVVGQPAPAFSVADSNGRTVSLADFKGKTVVLEWTDPECPFVQKHYNGAMQKLQADARRDGVVWLTVNSEGAGKQGAVSAAQANRYVRSNGLMPAAYLLDTSGAMARAYGARTTPHMFVINKEGVVAYAGGIDSIPSADPADTGRAQNFVQLALSDLKAGKAVATPSTRPYGCSIKF